MKKVISIFILTVSLVFIFNLSKIEVSAGNGVPYNTFTYSPSRDELVTTQDAYIPLSLTNLIGDLRLKNPLDVVVDKDDNVFIADTGNERVIKFNPANESIEPIVIGEGIFQEPSGLAVDLEGNLYVADPKTEKAYKFSFNSDTSSYDLKVTYQRPVNTPLFLDTDTFKPTKVVVDKGNNVYLVLAANVNGLAQFANNGEFFGFFGGNQIPATFTNIVRKLLFNEEQRRNWFKMIPLPIYNVAVDNKGSILSTTKSVYGYKKLNIGNTVILETDWGFENVEDLAVGPYNNVFTISDDGFITEYSNDASLLFIFGGRSTNYQKGLFNKASSIAVDSRNNIYSLDSANSALQIFYPTLFADTVHQALNLYQNGLYTESKAYWSEVLRMNSLFDLAHQGIAASYFADSQFKESMESYYYANDKEGYSNAYWEVRNIDLMKNAQVYIIVLLVLLLLYLINIKFKFFRYIVLPFAYINSKLNKYKIYNEIMYVFSYLRHPIDGLYGIKKENKSSVLSSSILLFIIYVFYILTLYFTGFIFNNNIIAEINILSRTITVLLPFALWVIANYLVCTIRDGEGKFSHVYQASVYSLSPIMVAMPVLILISNYLTVNEGFIYELLFIVAIFVSVIYIILMVKEIHNYEISNSITNILISIFTALMIAVVVFIIYILINEIYGFFYDIITEVISRG